MGGLRSAIIDGRLAPGSQVMEREIPKVRHTANGEVLRQMEAVGLVANASNKTLVVRALLAVISAVAAGLR